MEKVADYVRIKAASASKLNKYVTYMNPNMTVHPVYVTKVFISDFKRKSFTRLRMSQLSRGGGAARRVRKVFVSVTTQVCETKSMY